MKKVIGNRRILGILLLAASLAWAAPTTIAPADAQRYVNDIKALTQPNMEGRGDGTKGLVRAEHLLQARYKKLRLEPAGDHGYLQSFSVTTGAKLDGKNHLLIQNGETKSELKLNQEYVPFSFSSSSSATASMVHRPPKRGSRQEMFSYNLATSPSKIFTILPMPCAAARSATSFR